MPTSAPRARVLRFDDFELDVSAGQLRKRGLRLRLQGQPLQVLAVLLNRAGDVVTYEEIRSQIWSADTFVDFDHSLHNAIARLRETLGDSAETPRYIETLPRHGYRFIAPVESEEPADPSYSAPSAPRSPRRLSS
jgi:DNA-binding winged helix-turn-helix (wHTH) protein